MNIRTADRLRFTSRVLHFALTLVVAWIAVVAGIKVQRLEARVAQAEAINGKQTKALFIMGEALDVLLQLNPAPDTPTLPPLPLPTPAPDVAPMHYQTTNHQQGAQK